MSGKARNLEILAQNNVRTPRGFVVDESHFFSAIKPYTDDILEALPDAGRIEGILSQLSVSPDTTQLLDQGFSTLAGVNWFAVRSSARLSLRGAVASEDGENRSMAGQFESYLNVPRDLVSVAVRRCWASLFNARSIHQFNPDKEYIGSSGMTVIVQEMVHAAASAVIMTVDPQGAGDTGAIESTWGPCEAIVAGIVDPDEIIFDRRTGRILNAIVGRKEVYVAYQPFTKFGDNILRASTTPSERQSLALNPEIVRNLIALCHRIEDVFGRPQDIETVIDECGVIVVTQSRSVTTLPKKIIPFTLVNMVL